MTRDPAFNLELTFGVRIESEVYWDIAKWLRRPETINRVIDYRCQGFTPEEILDSILDEAFGDDATFPTAIFTDLVAQATHNYDDVEIEMFGIKATDVLDKLQEGGYLLDEPATGLEQAMYALGVPYYITPSTQLTLPLEETNANEG